ncbi:MAG: excinuclease ABC subunit UvrC, partial [Pseudomonadota bacterium]
MSVTSETPVPEPAEIGFEEDAAPGAGARATGPDVIKTYLPQLPSRPGVYRMLGTKGEVLYVGKARSLKARVTNYSRLQGNSARIQRMIMQTASMMFVTTPTETEALLLEANLIKQLKPRYNVILRDDKSFPHILVTGDHGFAAVEKHRGARKRKGRYFGPFASAGAVNRTLNQLQKAFLLRTCSDSVFESRTRPCLLHQIKRCAAPCTGLIDEAGYQALVDDAMRFLEGRSTKVQEELAERMRAASADLDFEQAAIYRDRIAALTRVQQAQGINPETVPEADVVAVHAEGGQACV